MSEFALPNKAVDLSGRRFGALTALRPIRTDRTGVWWLCKCDCGDALERRGAALRHGVGRQSCRACKRYRGPQTAGDLNWMRKVWEMTGSLYSCHGEPERVALTAQPRQKHCGWMDGGESDGGPTSNSPRFLPIEARRGYEFACVHCDARFSRGDGCAWCLEPVCPKCHHACVADPDGVALAAIGAALGVGQERVRQILDQAIYKLSRPHALKLWGLQ